MLACEPIGANEPSTRQLRTIHGSSTISPAAQNRADWAKGEQASPRERLYRSTKYSTTASGANQRTKIDRTKVATANVTPASSANNLVRPVGPIAWHIRTRGHTSIVIASAARLSV